MIFHPARESVEGRGGRGGAEGRGDDGVEGDSMASTRTCVPSCARPCSSQRLLNSVHCSCRTRASADGAVVVYTMVLRQVLGYMLRLRCQRNFPLQGWRAFVRDVTQYNTPLLHRCSKKLHFSASSRVPMMCQRAKCQYLPTYTAVVHVPRRGTAASVKPVHLSSAAHWGISTLLLRC